jgi:hypothetical protein
VSLPSGANDRAAIGFRIKSGWAAAVLLCSPVTSPRVLDSRRVELSDPAAVELRQPYHADFGVGITDGAVLTRRVRAIARYSSRSLSSLVNEYRKPGHVLCGAGLVVGSDVDPEHIANQHIRAHALEGRLFRRVVEDAMALANLGCSVWVERSLYAVAARCAGQSETQVRQMAAQFGRDLRGRWRSEEKLAALAAWLTLRSRLPISVRS